MSLSIFKVVSGGEVILASFEDQEAVVTWNGSLTFNLYSVQGGEFHVVDCRTSGHHPLTLAQAMEVAKSWFDGEDDDGEDDDEGEDA
jgi:hypothetical protein